jgi:hypothetical protein
MAQDTSTTTVPHDDHPDPETFDGSDADGRPPTEVPPGETPAAVCPYCDRPFADGGLQALHVGERHDDIWSEAEQAAYESAREDESDELFFYHLRVIAALAVVYALLVLVYMIVLA